MNKKQRLDKVLGHMGIGTRSELKKMVKLGRVQVNGSVVKDSGLPILPQADRIEVDGEVVHYREFSFKPAQFSLRQLPILPQHS